MKAYFGAYTDVESIHKTLVSLTANTDIFSLYLTSLTDQSDCVMTPCGDSYHMSDSNVKKTELACCRKEESHSKKINWRASDSKQSETICWYRVVNPTPIYLMLCLIWHNYKHSKDNYKLLKINLPTVLVNPAHQPESRMAAAEKRIPFWLTAAVLYLHPSYSN